MMLSSCVGWSNCGRAAGVEPVTWYAGDVRYVASSLYGLGRTASRPSERGRTQARSPPCRLVSVTRLRGFSRIFARLATVDAARIAAHGIVMVMTQCGSTGSRASPPCGQEKTARPVEAGRAVETPLLLGSDTHWVSADEFSVRRGACAVEMGLMPIYLNNLRLPVA
ncbi:hypothetical protein PT2222_100281 [Paraburkholderia tropica]